METVDVVIVLTLIASDFGYYHLRVYDGVLAKTLIHARPARIAAQIYYRIVHPWAVSCTTLIGSNLCTSEGQFGVERGTQVDGLGEECSALSISDTVIMVESVDIGDAQILH